MPNANVTDSLSIMKIHSNRSNTMQIASNKIDICVKSSIPIHHYSSKYELTQVLNFSLTSRGEKSKYILFIEFNPNVIYVPSVINCGRNTTDFKMINIQ